MRNDNRFLWIIIGLATLGFVIALWLLSVHLKFSTGQAGLTEGCSVIGNGHGCANIAVSDYSKPLGIPLPAIAMGYYFAILLLALWAWRNPQACYEPLYFVLLLSTLALPVTLLMAFIAKFKLHSICPGCIGLWTVNLLMWPVVLKQLQLSPANFVGAIAELIRPKKLNLSRGRIYTVASLSLGSLVVFCVVGVSALALQSQASMFGDKDRAIKEYQEGSVLFLNADMFKGPQVKGNVEGNGVIMDIVEFADLQCPACRMAAQYFKPFLMKHGDEVRLSYHNYPLDGSCNTYVPNGMHHSGCAAARSAICAGDQGKFFDFHDLVFDNQEQLNPDLLPDLAKKVGLDMDKFDACLKDPATETRLQKDIEWGESVKVEYTPTIIINGHKMGGALAPVQLEVLLDYLRNERKGH